MSIIRNTVIAGAAVAPSCVNAVQLKAQSLVQGGVLAEMKAKFDAAYFEKALQAGKWESLKSVRDQIFETAKAPAAKDFIRTHFDAKKQEVISKKGGEKPVAVLSFGGMGLGKSTAFKKLAPHAINLGLDDIAMKNPVFQAIKDVKIRPISLPITDINDLQTKVQALGNAVICKEVKVGDLRRNDVVFEYQAWTETFTCPNAGDKQLFADLKKAENFTITIDVVQNLYWWTRDTNGTKAFCDELIGDGCNLSFGVESTNHAHPVNFLVKNKPLAGFQGSDKKTLTDWQKTHDFLLSVMLTPSDRATKAKVAKGLRKRETEEKRQSGSFVVEKSQIAVAELTVAILAMIVCKNRDDLKSVSDAAKAVVAYISSAQAGNPWEVDWTDSVKRAFLTLVRELDNAMRRAKTKLALLRFPEGVKVAVTNRSAKTTRRFEKFGDLQREWSQKGETSSIFYRGYMLAPASPKTARELCAVKKWIQQRR